MDMQIIGIVSSRDIKDRKLKLVEYHYYSSFYCYQCIVINKIELDRIELSRRWNRME